MRHGKWNFYSLANIGGFLQYLYLHSSPIDWTCQWAAYKI